MPDNFAATITAAFPHAEATPFDPPTPPSSLVIELDEELFAALEAHALACGINPSALVVLWIKPHLRDLCRARRQSGWGPTSEHGCGDEPAPGNECDSVLSRIRDGGWLTPRPVNS